MQFSDHDGNVPSQPTGVTALEADCSSASVAIRIEYKGMQRIVELPLTLAMIGRLAYEAECRGMRITELIAELIATIARKDCISEVLGKL
jgi:hypothetical protein